MKIKGKLKENDRNLGLVTLRVFVLLGRPMMLALKLASVIMISSCLMDSENTQMFFWNSTSQVLQKAIRSLTMVAMNFLGIVPSMPS